MSRLTVINFSILTAKKEPITAFAKIYALFLRMDENQFSLF